jgi:hypothetical protein
VALEALDVSCNRADVLGATAEEGGDDAYDGAEQEEQQHQRDDNRPAARTLLCFVLEDLVRLEVALVGAWVCQESSRPHVLQGIAGIGLAGALPATVYHRLGEANTETRERVSCMRQEPGT